MASVHVYNIDSFSELWSPGTEKATTIALADLPSVGIPLLGCHTVDMHAPSGLKLNELILSAYESPAHQGLYRVWLYASNRENSTVSRYSMHSLGTSTRNQAFHLRQSTVSKTNDNVRNKMAYARHIHVSNEDDIETIRVRDCMGTLGDTLMVHDPDPLCAYYVDVSAYSGAMTFCVPEYIIIRYYQ